MRGRQLENGMTDVAEGETPPMTGEEEQILKDATAKDFVRMNRVMTRTLEYVLQGEINALRLRNDAIETDNQSGIMYYQGSYDVFVDLKAIMSGMSMYAFRIHKKESGMEVG